MNDTAAAGPNACQAESQHPHRNPIVPTVIRGDQALAAIRIGFLIRRVEHESVTDWTAPLMKGPDIDETFQVIERELLSLSHRFSDFEARKISDLRNQMAKLSETVFKIRADLILEKPSLGRDEMQQRIETDPEVPILKKLQRNLFEDFRNILLPVIGDDWRIAAWFEIGDRLGHTIFRFMRGEIKIPLSPFEFGELRSGVRKLPQHLQSRVGPFFPDPNREGYDLAAELGDTYEGLCNWILKLSPMARPVWDGAAIRYQGKSHSIKMQHNSVIVPILERCERLGWPLYITHKLDIDNVKQALLKFNKAKVVRLSQSGNQIRWHDPDELPQS